MTSTSNIDYWAILGLNSDSDLSELKKAFRREARKWHPDLNLDDKNAEERFKLINEAYEVLSKSAKFNLNLNKDESYNSNNIDFKIGFPTFEEYIERVLGIYNNSEEVKESEEYQNHKEIPDEYSYEDNYPVNSPDEPPPVKAFHDIETIVDLSPFEALHGTLVCLEIEDGNLVEISTPPRAGDGWRLRLENVVRGCKDHYIHLKVQTEDGLRIDGLKVLYRLELTPPDALLGCAVEVPTLDGYVTLQVPPRSSTGRLLRLKGRGLEYDDEVGDQFVEIIVVMPIDISDEEIALYTRLQELSLIDD
tara:strand:+ start:7682 stop:8599 length:918 start_codon:yes stop_codon:yes gene_type:complete